MTEFLSDRNALLVELCESTLEDQLLDRGAGRVTVGNIRLRSDEACGS
jgi:hypothetical protein